ncbi:helix-turn-helix domain-containing protein [Micromonospora sp. AMSO1212t]|uniref:helix-turn-helix domain-containing protein n=1 Tax=Micromonospora sp. AMSO1212t TaxID=2650565 RepID=UPI00124BB0FD|nr:helix-turn-helix transcriptional regulator [Micromonospora sp. AMSO1212t]KAB1907384.1 helix-turn-helix domain-containing protein [Micromonospora sp. AMSO1212t]
MTTVQKWTGRETRMLRHALRMSIRDFAEHLGVSERTVSKWEAGRDAVQPRPEMQAALDTALVRASDEAVARFCQATGNESPGSAASVTSGYRIQSHKFIPAHVGGAAVRELATLPRVKPRPHEWLHVWTTDVPHPDGQCTAHVFACGVVVLHLQQELTFRRLAELAAWRYASYEDDLPWAARRLECLLSDQPDQRAAAPEYVMSMYLPGEMGCRREELSNAVRLLSLPSVLVNRHAAPRPQPVPENVERTLLTKGFDQPTAVPFGIAGVSVGFATWSGLAYHAISPERALTADELVSLEIDVQMLWAYCRQVQRVVENGRDPVVPHGFGWRFLRAAHSRLTTARVQETAQHCMMRQAAVTTSGLPERLTQAQAALREAETTVGRVGV